MISSETYAYDPDDVLKRSHSVTYLDGTSQAFGYDCCGLQWETNRDGTVTQHFYDDLKRRTASLQLQLSITVTNVLDANGNVLRTIRNPGGSEIVLHQAKYDLAGQVTRETNALNGITGYTNYFDGGYFVNKTTYPDTGARIKTFSQDGKLQSETGTAVFPVYYGYGADTNGAYTIQTNGSPTGSEWTKTYTDMMGRPYKTVYPDNAYSQSFYNHKGQLWKQRGPDDVITLFKYNDKGEQEYTLTALSTTARTMTDYANLNVAGLLSGSDRITKAARTVVAGTPDLIRGDTSVWEDGSSNPKLISRSETSADGLKSWNTVWNNGVAVTSQSATRYIPASGLRIVTNTAPDNSYTVTTNQYGRLISVTRRDSNDAQIGQTIYGYDSHGQQNTVKDARNDTTTYTFNDADQIVTTTTPVPASGQSAQVTTSYYDSMGRLWKTVLPDGGVVTNDFSPAGQVGTISGARTYASGSGYDAQGRLKTLTNWSAFPSGGARTTTWNYDSYRGWLASKSYPDGQGPAYGYTDAGRLETRAWARGTNTSYAYNYAGELSTVGYNDGSPSVGTEFNRRGRVTSVTHGASFCTSAFNDAGLLLSDSYSGGVLNGVSVTNGYDSFLRRNVLALNPQLSTLNTTYGYDDASRLSGVSAGVNSATYSYLANSPLIEQVFYRHDGALQMTRTNQYDKLNRLTNLIWKAGATTVASFAYQYNNANQRTRATLADGSYWLYQYDNLGQVTSAKKYWSDGSTPVAGQQTTCDFDDIGNRKSAASGGDHTGANLRSASYGANLLNQYTNRTVPGYLNIIGSATNTASVSVNDRLACRRGDYYRAELTVNNAAGPVWLSVTNLAVMPVGSGNYVVSNVTGNVYVPQSPEAFAYDADGNLTNSGRWTITWDAENRVTSFTRISGAPSGAKVKVECQYDYRWCRTQKIVSTWNGSAYVPQSTNKFVYDGWNLIAVLDATNGLVQSFTWGMDVSGTMQGAGGVGGLLSMTVHLGTNVGTYFYCFDGNGNVAALVNAADSSVAAQYDYGAFGELLRATGPLAFANPFRFSTKYQDNETGLLYYGYRYYDPDTGRWLNRDPIGELGFRRLVANRKSRPSLTTQQNLYRFVNNDPLGNFDPDGLDVYKIHIPAGISTGGSSVDHREIVGDDGNGGVYILSFDKDPCCGISILGASIYGKGKVTLTRASNISAADWAKENGGTIKKTVVTPHADVDKTMSETANSYEKWKPTYVLGFYDCGSVANKFIEDAEKAVQRWDDRINENFELP